MSGLRAAAIIVALAAAAPSTLGASTPPIGVGYICSAEHRDAIEGPSRLVILPGMGSGGFPIQTRSPAAQAWFDYGLKLYHAFYHDDAKAAFARAEALDPDCAMCAWGEALALGPTLNYAISPPETAAALAQANRAAQLAQGASDKDKALIKALQDRYRAVAPGTKTEPAYAQAMDAIATRYPDDDDVAALAAHALITPWRSGDTSGVPRAMVLLQGVLARHPNNTAAIHYYIHATEFAGRPELALPYAERLARLAPAASHLVHMGAHTLLHLGRYEDVAILNARALKIDADHETALNTPGPVGAATYYLHNYSFGITGAVMAGDQALALKFADDANIAFPAGSDPERRQAALARSLIAYARFDPRRALAAPEPLAGQIQLQIMRHNARGEAFAQLDDVAGVLAEAKAAQAIADGPALPPNNLALARITQRVLEGRAAMLQGRYADAVRAYAQGATLQEQAFGTTFDPPPWWYPVRRSLAAADLMAGRYADAEREAEASLGVWREDALALWILAKAEAVHGKTALAQAHMDQARRDWRGTLDQVAIATV